MVSKNKNEWVIHIWGKERDKLELNDVEKFHIDMLKMFQEQHSKFDKVLVNIALDNIDDMKLFDFLKENVGNVINNKNVEFKYCQNDPFLCECVTFKPYVFDRIGEDVNIFYSHFKGYRSFFISRRESFPMRVVDLSEMFWSYMMYSYSMNFEDVQEKFNEGKCVYCWFVLKGAKELDYYKKYQDTLQKENPEFADMIEDDLGKHSPGSFVWYNMKSIGESLKNKPLVRDVTMEFLKNGCIKNVCSLCTHFCELYLLQFLKEDECYSVNDFNDAFIKVQKNLYLSLYPSKKIGKELLDEFNKYLIENGLI